MCGDFRQHAFQDLRKYITVFNTNIFKEKKKKKKKNISTNPRKMSGKNENLSFKMVS